jgi:hypothetical protein
MAVATVMTKRSDQWVSQVEAQAAEGESPSKVCYPVLALCEVIPVVLVGIPRRASVEEQDDGGVKIDAEDVAADLATVVLIQVPVEVKGCSVLSLEQSKALASVARHVTERRVLMCSTVELEHAIPGQRAGAADGMLALCGDLAAAKTTAAHQSQRHSRAVTDSQIAPQIEPNSGEVGFPAAQFAADGLLDSKRVVPARRRQLV